MVKILALKVKTLADCLKLPYKAKAACSMHQQQQVGKQRSNKYHCAWLNRANIISLFGHLSSFIQEMPYYLAH